jgi:hypothetical protein
MLKGECNNEFPSPLLRETKSTAIWNTCSSFEPAEFNNFVEEMALEVENNQD